MTDGKLHQRIKAKKLDKSVEKEFIDAIEEMKKAKPEYDYTTENSPPKDPLEAALKLEDRRLKWLKEFLGE